MDPRYKRVKDIHAKKFFLFKFLCKALKIINFRYFLSTFQSSQVLLFGKFCVCTKYMIPDLFRKAIQDQEH